MSGQIDAFGAMIRKLERLANLDEIDRAAIEALSFQVSTVAPGETIVREGQRVSQCCVLLDGFAFRHKVAANGNRQILSFHLPGDILDLQHLFLPRADHNVQTITAAQVAWIPIDALRSLIRERPAVGEALWQDSLIDASIFREWVLNVGQRDAKSRIAHMLCEFAIRRAAAGLGSPEQFELPMTQEQIADATGLTSVHVNRMLQSFGAEGVIRRDKRNISVANWDRMRRVADFDPAYLHAAA